MRKARSSSRSKPMREEYNFSGGVRGKYAERFARGSNVVVLEPDVARAFPDSEAVNSALRALKEIAQRQPSKPAR
jgi:hypothetical protein